MTHQESTESDNVDATAVLDDDAQVEADQIRRLAGPSDESREKFEDYGE